MLPRRHRLTRPSEFRAVLRGAPGLQRRRPVGTDLLVVHAATGQESGSAPPTRPQRVGFVVSRAVGNSVVRHRVVRRLRAQVADRLGLGEAVVQGAVNPDEFYVYKPALAQKRPAILKRGIGGKATKMVYTQDRSVGRTTEFVDVDEDEDRLLGVRHVTPACSARGTRRAAPRHRPRR